MNTILVNTLRVPSLLLAAALQMLPIVRVALPATHSASNVIVILFRWCAGVAALGSVQAVSGGSTVITCPKQLQATNGVPFSQRLTTAPHQSTYWIGNNVPPGLTVSGAAGLWRLAGTPTASGTYNVKLTAKEAANSSGSRTVSTTITMTIVSIDPAAPEITSQPVSISTAAGQDATFSVTASGFPPPSYQWRFNGVGIPGETNATLHLTSVTAAQAGQYSAVVNNTLGALTSDSASLAVTVSGILPEGTYNGLYFDPSEPDDLSSGFLSVTISGSGAFNATLQNGRKKTAYRGQFSAEGHATNEVPRAGLEPLKVELHANFDSGNKIVGHVKGDGWIAPLSTRLQAATAGNRTGSYTLIVPGADIGAEAPVGDGFASLKILSTGGVLLSGMLADGTRITQRVALGAAGEVPVYVPLYSGNGVIFGWLHVRPSGEIDLEGALTWIRPPGPAPKLYTSGFKLNSQVSGSEYVRTTGPLFGLSSARVILTGGNLSEPLANNATISSAGKIEGAGPDKLTLKVTPATGLFKGVITRTGAKPTRIQGAVLQQQRYGSGFFLGTSESGNVYLGP